MSAVLNHSKASGTDLNVLMGIANHYGDGGAWPSIATLCRYAKRDARTVKRILRRLEASGEITTYTQQGGTHMTPDRSRPNRYELHVTCPPECDRSTNHRIRDRGVTGATPGGGTDDTRGVAPVTPEPSLEPSCEPAAAQERENARETDERDEPEDAGDGYMLTRTERDELMNLVTEASPIPLTARKVAAFWLRFLLDRKPKHVDRYIRSLYERGELTEIIRRWHYDAYES